MKKLLLSSFATLLLAAQTPNGYTKVIVNGHTFYTPTKKCDSNHTQRLRDCTIPNAGPAANERSDKYVMNAYKKVIGPEGKRIVQKHKYYESSLDDIAAEIAYQLYTQYNQKRADKEPIILTSFVDVHDFNQTSNFGRLLSETLGTHLDRLGMPIYEYRIKNRLVVNKNGEFFLTRDVKGMRRGFVDGYVLTGTYGLSKDRLILNARLVEYQSGRVIASANLDVRDRKLVRELCQNGLCRTSQATILPISGE